MSVESLWNPLHGGRTFTPWSIERLKGATFQAVVYTLNRTRPPPTTITSHDRL